MKCPRCGHEMTLDTHRKYALNMCYECGYIEGRLIDPEKKGESNFERMKKLNFNEMVAFLTKGLKITLRDDREEKKEKTFHYEGGIREFVEYLNRSNVPLYEQVFYCEGQKDGVLVEVAMQHNDSYTENIYSFVNNINTPEGGTHLTGFKNALTKTFNDYGR